jgi:hypothetical protein
VSRCGAFSLIGRLIVHLLVAKAKEGRTDGRVLAGRSRG